jgi:hypothetical protein
MVNDDVNYYVYDYITVIIGTILCSRSGCKHELLIKLISVKM